MGGIMMKKALLVASFGTSQLEAFQTSISAVEQGLSGAFPDRDFRRAFLSGRIRTKLNRQFGIKVDGVVEALAALRMEGYEDVLVQPTLLLDGEEMEYLRQETSLYARLFPRFAVGRPLLTTIRDYQALADAIVAQMPKLEADEALVLVGNGSASPMNAVYPCLEYVLHDKGYPNIYIGTVEGYPTVREVLRRLDEAWDIQRVCLMPLMMSVGSHLRRDLGGDSPESWENQLRSHRIAVRTEYRALGENPLVRSLLILHAQEALRKNAGWQGLL
jgi:sirohydrochlorin cobaltochelatase